VLEQRAVLLQRPPEVVRLVRGAKAAPGDEVCARRDGRRRVDLQQRQLLHHAQQVGRPARVQQLRTHRDPPCLLLGELVHG
jgi:hypothetical protein